MKKLQLLLFALLCLGIGVGKGQFTLLHSFNYTYGGAPCYSVTLSGKMLYGSTEWGGANDSGCIFSVDTNGNSYKDLFDFNSTSGSFCTRKLTPSGAKLFGMTSRGGSYGYGCIFSIDTNGKGYKDLLDFDDTNGSYPNCSLALSGGVLYGITMYGGPANDGIIFAIDTNGGRFRDLFNFNGTNGRLGQSDLVLSGPKLFGTTQIGGTNSNGNIFSIDTNGNNFKDIYDFTSTNGSYPSGKLIISGKTSYGCLETGGTSGDGTVFSVDTSGSGYRNLYNFSGGVNGKYPLGSMVLQGSVLIGTTIYGGIYNDGNIFTIDTDGSGYKDLWDFDYNVNTNGAFPSCLFTISGNTIYGTTSEGGADTLWGVIFKFRDVALSINNVVKTQGAIDIFPNPSSGVFTIGVESEKLKMKSIEAFNVIGERVLTEILRSAQDDKVMDLSNQPNGVYFYRVVGEDGGLIGEGKLILDK